MKFCISGGGISGLIAAYELTKKFSGSDISIFEKDKIGGQCQWFEFQNYQIDSLYHLFFQGDRYIRELLNELGIKSSLNWVNTGFKLYQEEKQFDFSGPLSFLKSPFTLKEKFFFGKILANLFFVKDIKYLDKTRASEWLISNTSLYFYESFLGPFLKIKWKEYSDNISLAWLKGRIMPRSLSRANIFSSEKLGYLKGGLYSLVNSLIRNLKSKGVTINEYSEIVDIMWQDKGVKDVVVRCGSKKKKISCDYFVNTLAAPIFLKIVRGSTEERTFLNEIKYMGLISYCFVLQRKIIDSCEIFFLSKDSPIGGAVQIPGAFFGGGLKDKFILYVFNYFPSEDEIFKDADALKREFIKTLSKHFSFKPGKDILHAHQYKNQYVEPFFSTSYLDVMPPHKIGNTFWLGNFNSYPNCDINSIIKNSKKIISLIPEEN